MRIFSSEGATCALHAAGNFTTLTAEPPGRIDREGLCAAVGGGGRDPVDHRIRECAAAPIDGQRIDEFGDAMVSPDRPLPGMLSHDITVNWRRRLSGRRR